MKALILISLITPLTAAPRAEYGRTINNQLTIIDLESRAEIAKHIFALQKVLEK